MNLSKLKEQIENNGRALPGGQPSFLDPSQDKFELNPEALTQLQLSFEDEATMQRAFELMVSFSLNFNEHNAAAVPGPQKSRLQVYNWLLTNQVEFWKFNSISEEQFLRQVDTGDILLFRCNTQSIFGAWITRAFTNSHYDHVSILMRFGP